MIFGRSLTRVELARVQGTLETLVATVAAGQSDHEARIRRMERWIYSVPLSALAAIAAAAAAIIHR